MAEQIATEEGLCVNEFDLSGISSNFGGSRSADIKEKVCFPGPDQGAGSRPTKSRLVGPQSIKLDVAGYLDAEINLAAAEAALSTYSVATYLSARALGSRVYMFEGAQSNHEFGGQVGEIIPMTLNMSNNGAIYPGNLYEYSAGTLISATGNGTSRTITAVTLGKSRCLHIHVVASTGTAALVVIWETSVIGDYSDAITKHTFATITAPAVGYERAIKTATDSDTNGRFRWTVTGTGTFRVRFSEGSK